MNDSGRTNPRLPKYQAMPLPTTLDIRMGWTEFTEHLIGRYAGYSIVVKGRWTGRGHAVKHAYRQGPCFTDHPRVRHHAAALRFTPVVAAFPDRSIAADRLFVCCGKCGTGQFAPLPKQVEVEQGFRQSRYRARHDKHVAVW